MVWKPCSKRIGRPAPRRTVSSSIPCTVSRSLSAIRSLSLIAIETFYRRGRKGHAKVAKDLRPSFAYLYRPELTLTRQKGCVGAGSRVADVVVGVWGTTMCALAIRD